MSFYGFYALQPYLLQLWGDSQAYALAGITAAILAGAQVVGGMLVPYFGRFFHRRTTLLFTATLLTVLLISLMGAIANFWVVIILVVLWGLVFAAVTPVRQAYINSLIPAKQRATVLSFDSLLGSSGGVVIQPVLGKSADAWGYPASYLLGGALQAIALPFAWLTRREAKKPHAQQADIISGNEDSAKP